MGAPKNALENYTALLLSRTPQKFRLNCKSLREHTEFYKDPKSTMGAPEKALEAQQGAWHSKGSHEFQGPLKT